MEISYELTFYDYWNFNKFSIFHSPKIRNINFVLFLVFTVIIIQRIMKNPSDTLGANLFSFLFQIIVFALLYYFILWSQALYVSKKSNILGDQTVTISEDGIIENTSFSKSFFKWHGIKYIKFNKLYFFIFLTDSTGIIIPKRAFTSDVESDNFLYTAKAFYNKSKVIES